ncbi:MAG: hypothetical protein F4003_05785 [Acidimicrobiaceae bacterium]|nr:hypothetical protein [Acidimicrobiaceae bacterium]MYC41611.1 hypothetical protein [Acidimicrobiaceae bacterium]MYH87464.1 hypothetical protein [Acidimicrobiaceae bacterium]
MLLPDIDFKNIRSFGPSGSRTTGFEELVCTLLERTRNWPEGTMFERFGDPDGGREGHAVLPNGTVHAWQAKYFFRFDSSAASQVERSFKRALETEPELVGYTVVLPIDLPAGDTQNRTSARTRWDTKVEEWRTLAEKADRNVEFEFVGNHELVQALLKPGQEGLLRYWFDESCMDDAWFRERLEGAVVKAGPRYSSELHVDVEAAQALEGLGRTKAFRMRWREVLADLRKSRRYSWQLPEDVSDELTSSLVACNAALDKVDTKIASIVAALSGFGDLPDVDGLIQSAESELYGLQQLLHVKHPPQNGYYTGTAGSLRVALQEALRVLHRLSSLANSTATRAARKRQLLIEGVAGTGKTHLLCDIAQQRVNSGLPTVLLMGQDFDRRTPRIQIPELTAFDGTVEQEVAALAVASEAAGTVGLLMVDALNESEKASQWKDDLGVLCSIVDRHDQVALAVSCRTEFLPDVVGENAMSSLRHEGFGEAVDSAVKRFARHHGLESVNFPALHPEFTNPLFLKLACKALQTLGHGHFPLGSAGLTTVCNAFLEAVNERLASQERCDFDKSSCLVQNAVRALAIEGTDSPSVPRAKAEQVLNYLLPRERWSESLLKGLLDEGVLIKTPAGIGFAYQRLGDMARASLICEGTENEIKEWVDGLGHNRWAYEGVLRAVAVMLPESQGIELCDLLDNDDGGDLYENHELLVQSLALRSPGSVSGRTIQLVRHLLSDGALRDSVLDQLVRLSCLPEHALNAAWLHAWLIEQGVAQRDASWSLFLVGRVEPASPVGQVITWARDNSDETGPEVRRLAALTLGWLLTTSDNRVRDRATKALVALFDADPLTAQETLQQFRSVNDPYVVERLTGAACGAALRSRDDKAHHQLATGVAGLIDSDWPDHLFTRDYAHRVFQLALTAGWIPPDGADPNGCPYSGPPYGTTLPSPTLTVEEIETMAGPPDRDYLTIWLSLDSFGDFGHYVVSPAIGDFENQDGLFELARRAIFERVINLGWTPEVFRQVDGDLGSGSRTDHAVERIGKKYQRIAFYELLGNLTDNLRLAKRYSGDPPSPYQYLEKIAWRDIDPTIISQQPEIQDNDRPQAWFSPVVVTFGREQPCRSPNDTSKIPDPLDLIAVTDNNGAPWLALESFPKWQETLLPDEKALNPPKLYVWMQIRSYLIPLSSLPSIRNWALGKDWFGRWMPEPSDVHNVLLASHPHDPAWELTSSDPDFHRPEQRPPCDLWVTTTMYCGTGGERDQSAPTETQGIVPSRHFYNVLGLARVDEFLWEDQHGVVVKDPSTTEVGTAFSACKPRRNHRATQIQASHRVLDRSSRNASHRGHFPGQGSVECECQRLICS